MCVPLSTIEPFLLDVAEPPRERLDHSLGIEKTGQMNSLNFNRFRAVDERPMRAEVSEPLSPEPATTLDCDTASADAAYEALGRALSAQGDESYRLLEEALRLNRLAITEHRRLSHNVPRTVERGCSTLSCR